MTSLVAVIDYGMGNLHSVAKALEHVADGKHLISVTHEPETIRSADRVVFPGVGAIRDCMAEIKRLDIHNLIYEAVAEKPLLAVCVGMQALMDHSEENNGVECLKVFPGAVEFFGDPLVDDSGDKLKVPHMGWNTVQQTMAHPMWSGIANNSHFYFVHSYRVTIDDSDQEFVAGSCEYGTHFAAAMAKPNVFATQFHPEKSHRDGLQLYRNFLNWDGSP